MLNEKMVKALDSNTKQRFFQVDKLEEESRLISAKAQELRLKIQDELDLDGDEFYKALKILDNEVNKVA